MIKNDNLMEFSTKSDPTPPGKMGAGIVAREAYPIYYYFLTNPVDYSNLSDFPKNYEEYTDMLKTVFNTYERY